MIAWFPLKRYSVMLFEEFLSDSNWTASSIKLFKLNHTATIYDVWWICMIVVANWQASPWKLVRLSLFMPAMHQTRGYSYGAGDLQ